MPANKEVRNIVVDMQNALLSGDFDTVSCRLREFNDVVKASGLTPLEVLEGARNAN